MTPAVDFFRALPVSGKGLALLGSISMHAAIALAAARGAPHAPSTVSAPVDSVVELAPLEVLPVDAPEPTAKAPNSQSTPATATARHHHDYPVAPTHDATPHDPSLRHLLPLPTALNAPAATAPAVVESPAPTAPAPRFVMTVAPVTRALGGASAESGSARPAAEGSTLQPATESSVDRPATLLAGGTPSYTLEAQAAGIEADVPLEIVVDSAGSVVSARALTHVGYGLDEAALRSVRGYHFKPAQRAGKPLAVRMRWLMRFQLR